MNTVRSLIAFLLLLPPAALGQQEPFRERLEVSAVLVDVTVTDKRGNQILGLTKDDFIVTEDGAEQTIDSLDYFTNRRLLTGTEESAGFKVEKIRPERYFILMLHKPGSARFMSEVLEARSAATDFVNKEMLPTDLVAVVSYDIRLRIFSDFTSDKKQLRDALREAGSFSRGITRPGAAAAEGPSILRNLDLAEMINDTSRIYDAIRLLANSVRGIPARKVLVLFSPGIGEPSDFSPTIPENEEFRFRPMMSALNRANVTVFAMPLPKGRGPHATESNLYRMAQETGGEYFRNVVNYASPLRRVENLSSGYYLLTYSAKKPVGASGFQRIQIRLRNPEFRVRAREGYGYGGSRFE